MVMTKAVRVMIKMQNVMACIKKKKNGYIALCVINGFMKNASMDENSITSIDLYVRIYKC